MPAWPETLPQYVLAAGYGEQPPDLLVRSEMETGPPSRRRRFTAGETVITCRIAVSAVQKGILEAFFMDDLKAGSLTFEWVHPVHRGAVVMAMGVPGFAAESGRSFIVELELRVQP